MERKIIKNPEQAGKLAGEMIVWCTENPEAITALLDGRAAVVPLRIDDIYINIIGEHGVISNTTRARYYLREARLDKPKEAM